MELPTAFMVDSSDQGFDQFSFLRATLERPNSAFLDTALRYADSDSTKRLKMLKTLEPFLGVTIEQIMCGLKLCLGLSILAFGLYFAVKYKFLAFPALGVN